ncbi:uncharacterized protein LOC124119937 [Haliotis rufescens]|uniref:uncharacterized protein LOC124119937 n=1 Tax=Haliotis rufescens TaxID=6454 RepID=UPI00201ECEA7|nr:uncharacterized protein LOC124119937 [Haliotis rufescens]
MRRKDLTDIVSSLALLHLLWGLYTYCSLSSHLLLCVLVIHHLHVHRQESGDDYISENFNIDRLYEERPEFFEELKKNLTRLNCNQSSSQWDRGLVHSLHGEAAHNACATTERFESSITRLSVGGSPQLPNIPRNNTTDLEPSMTSMAASGVSNDQPYAESEHSGHDPLSGSDLEVDNEAESHSVNCCNRHDVNVDEPNKSVAAETDGLVVDTATADESKVDTATPDESKVDKANADESKVDKATADESKVDKATPDESKVDTVIADESKVGTAIADESKVDTVIADESKVGTAIADESKVGTAIADESKVDKAIADESKVDKATADESKVDKATADESKVNKAIADESKVVKATADESKVDKDTADESKVDTATPDESKVDTATPDESKVNTVIAEESKVDKATADELKVDMAIADESKVDTATPDESKVDTATPDESPKENAVLPKTDYSQNQTLDDTKENLKTTDKPSNLTSQHLEDKDSSLIIDRTQNEREVSLSRSNSPTNLREDEDAVNPVSIYDVSRNRENKQVPGPQQADMRKAGKSCVSTRHQGNPGQRSQTCVAVFSPTDDPEKLQSHQREHYPQATSSDPVLLPTYPLVDGQHHETTESSIPENTDVCKNQVQRPGPTLTDPEAKHDRCSDHNNGCMELHKQMTKQTVNLQEEPTKSTTTQADRKNQQARSSDQDNVCLNGQPSSSQEAPVELHPTKLEAQKKQKGTDADVEKEDKPSDGRPSVKDKGTTPLTEELVNLTQQTYFQSSMSNISITLSAGSRQNGNQPVTIQRDHTEKWPTESSSDSE